MPQTNPLVDRLLDLCPEATDVWREHLASWGEEERGVFNDLAVLARFVVEAAARGEFEPADRFFAFIEASLPPATEEMEGFLVWGLLEDIQTVASHTEGLRRALALRLATKTLAQWGRIAEVWAGKTSLADVIREEARRARDGED